MTRPRSSVCKILTTPANASTLKRDDPKKELIRNVLWEDTSWVSMIIRRFCLSPVRSFISITIYKQGVRMQHLSKQTLSRNSRYVSLSQDSVSCTKCTRIFQLSPTEVTNALLESVYLFSPQWAVFVPKSPPWVGCLFTKETPEPKNLEISSWRVLL